MPPHMRGSPPQRAPGAIDTDQLTRLSRETPLSCLNAVATHLQTSGRSLLARLACSGGQRQPENVDVMAQDGHYRWFYHAHKGHQGTGRAGHFHLFAAPAAFRDHLTRSLTHLIAVELDEDGDLAGFFAPNIWCTNEYMRPAEQITGALRNFQARINTPDMIVSIWVEALVREFTAEIADLLCQRDAFIMRLNPLERTAYFADRSVSRICEWRAG